MNKPDITDKIRKKAGVARLRNAMVASLREMMANKPPDVDREKCFADAADRVLEVLRSELFEEALEPATELEEAQAQAKAEHVAGDFDRIVKQVVSDVRTGYLVSNLQMMKALGSAIAERDAGDSGHNLKVTLYSAKLGEEVGLDQDQMQALIKGSFLHDIGKISISDAILLKPDRLTRDETTKMHNHVLFGAHILKEVKWLEDATDVVMFHHEHWDGTGYLSGLSREKIPLNARIFTIVDVFDALTSGRPYKQAYSYDQTMEYLHSNSGTLFDPNLLETFSKISRELYEQIAMRDQYQLDKLIHEMIINHFNIDLADTRLKSKYSIL
jgi:putative nucleotidyltransferase with HDIG domain